MAESPSFLFLRTFQDNFCVFRLLSWGFDGLAEDLASDIATTRSEWNTLPSIELFGPIVHLTPRCFDIASTSLVCFIFDSASKVRLQVLRRHFSR